MRSDRPVSLGACSCPWLVRACLAVLATGAACSAEGAEAVEVRTDVNDAMAGVEVDEFDAAAGSETGVGGDASGPETDASEVDAVSDDAQADVEVTPPRASTFRAIGGMSMGAVAINIALEHPGTFDVVGALGGYADSTYMMAQMLRLHFRGFCPLEQLAARTDLDDPLVVPPVTCGPGATYSPLEYAQEFNHLHYDTNGITMTRGFYAEIIDNFSCAYGNLALPMNPLSPLFPIGVDLAWWRAHSEAERCAAPVPIPQALSYNLEYNPVGAYPVIPLCDIDHAAQPGLLPSDFDVTVPRDRSISALLAVDINANGRRDYGEPLFLNPWERFEDVGVDGCDNAREDGAGGCVAVGARAPGGLGDDPNHDDYAWDGNPSGTERNDGYELGEPFSDLGVDGVSASVSGAPDLGEGNGVWDAVPAFANLVAHDADTKIRSASEATLAGMDFWVDAGIRDALHAGVVARNIVAALRARGREPRVYHDFGGREGSLLPEVDPLGFTQGVFAADLAPAAIGRDVYVEYGNPNATQQEIDDGDGKHVGTSIDALNRIAAFLAVAIRRMPEPDVDGTYDLPMPVATSPSFYSQALAARRGFTIAVPPGYDAPENATRRYPTVYFLHGLGQDANDLGPAAVLTGLFMGDGRLPKAIMVFPDGACCFVDRETGGRECACGDERDGVRGCVDPRCEADDEASCAVRQIPNARLQRECQKGSLYADMAANRWGDARSDLGYKTSVFELVAYVDKLYRTRAPTTR